MCVLANGKLPLLINQICQMEQFEQYSINKVAYTCFGIPAKAVNSTKIYRIYYMLN